MQKYNDHANDIGDWCPWSGKPVTAPPSDCDDYCPAMCAASRVIDAPERAMCSHGRTDLESCDACVAQVEAAASQVLAKLPDSDALDRITDVLSGQEWDADTPERIAEIVALTGRVIRDLPEYEGDAAE